MFRSKKPWIISALTTSDRRGLPSTPRAQVIHIYPNSDGGGNSTLNLSSVSQPLLALFSDGKHTVKGILTENALQNVGTRLDVDKESLIGGYVALVTFQVHANLTVENELDRELLLIIEKFSYLGGEGGRMDKRGLIDSWTMEVVRRRLKHLVGEGEASMLNAPGEMTQLLCCLDDTEKSGDHNESDGRFANVSALKLIATHVVDDDDGCSGDDVTKVKSRLPLNAHVISADQQEKIDELIKQITEQPNRTHREEDITKGGDRTANDKDRQNHVDEPSLVSSSQESFPSYVLPNQLIDKFSENQEPVELIIPAEVEDDSQAGSPGLDLVIIDLEDQESNKRKVKSSEGTNKEDKEEVTSSSEKLEGTSMANQSSDTTTFSGGSSGPVAENQQENLSRRIHTNKSVLGFNVSALPSSVVAASIGIPGNQEQRISGETTTSRQQSDKKATERQEETLENASSGESRDALLSRDETESEGLVDVSEARTEVSGNETRNQGRKRRRLASESEVSSVYPKRFLSLKLKRVETKHDLVASLISKAPADEDTNSELYQFCLQYWKTKKDPPLINDLFRAQ